MRLSDITNVFSRYFIVGFFLPAYGALVALWLTASSAFIPNDLQRYKEAAVQLGILGGVALVAGLAFSGLNYPLTRWMEGYPLLSLQSWPILGWIPRLGLALQRLRYRRWLEVAKDLNQPIERQAGALWRLDQFFPHGPAEFLPTRFGNAVRAFELHSNERWGLDGVTIWPRIEALLGSDERELLLDAKIDLYVFFNAAIGSLIVGICLVVDKAVNDSNLSWYWALYAIPFVLGYLLYRASIGPAVRWGDQVRASIDLHRLEFYESVGIARPKSFSDERERAVTINQFLLFARPPLPDTLWQRSKQKSDGAAPGKVAKEGK